MFVKIHEGEIHTYPYSPAKLAKDNPNISFPKVPFEGDIPKHITETLESFGVFSVTENLPSGYNSDLEKIKKKNYPTFVNNSWVIEWEIIPLSSAEITAMTEATSIAVREKRNLLLDNSDWLVIRSLETGIPVEKAWTDYRNSLRDISAIEGFPSIVEWPKAPRTP
jgi:hypothetical protein